MRDIIYDIALPYDSGVRGKKSIIKIIQLSVGWKIFASSMMTLKNYNEISEKLVWVLTLVEVVVARKC